MTTEVDDLRNQLIKEYGLPVKRFIDSMPTEFQVLGNTPVDSTLKYALFQCLCVEKAVDFSILRTVFRVEGDPLFYYREKLIETKGLDEARETFDKLWIKEVKPKSLNGSMNRKGIGLPPKIDQLISD